MSTRFFLAMAAALVFVGCGGNSGSSGSGGAGGASSASTGGAPAAGGAGGAGEGGGLGGGRTSGTGHGPSSASGSGGGSTSCDAIGQCGDMSSGCLGCSFGGPCANEAEACYHDQDCGDYQSCLGNCTKGDLTCAGVCQQQHPSGAEEFAHLYLCAVCQQCSTSCADTDMLCPMH